MGNVLASDAWTELCNPQRNVMTHRDPESMHETYGYEPLKWSAEGSKSISENCCGEVCTPRRSVTTMVKTDRKPVPVSTSEHTASLGQTCQECPSNASDDIKPLWDAHVASSRSTATRRSYAPPQIGQHGATSACIDSPRNTSRAHKIAQDKTSLNPSGDSVMGSNPLKHLSSVGGLRRTDSRDFVLERSFHSAAERGALREMQALLACPSAASLANSTDADGNTPLHKAAWYGHAAACELLCKSGAGLYVRNMQGLTAYDLSAHASNEDPEQRLEVIAFFLREDSARRAARQPTLPVLPASPRVEECHLSATFPAGSYHCISETNMERNGHWQVGRPADPISLSLIKNVNALPTALGHVQHQQTHQTTAGRKFWRRTVRKEQQTINPGSNRAAANFDADSDASVTGTDSRNSPLMQHLSIQFDTNEQIANVDTLRQSAVQQLPISSTRMSSTGMAGLDGKGAEVLGLGQDETAFVNCHETEGLEAATNVGSKDCSDILRTQWTPTAMRGEGGGTSPAAFRPFVRCGLRASCSTAAHP